jgi:hypothetical protein
MGMSDIKVLEKMRTNQRLIERAIIDATWRHVKQKPAFSVFRFSGFPSLGQKASGRRKPSEIHSIGFFWVRVTESMERTLRKD